MCAASAAAEASSAACACLDLTGASNDANRSRIASDARTNLIGACSSSRRRPSVCTRAKRSDASLVDEEEDDEDDDEKDATAKAAVAAVRTCSLMALRAARIALETCFEDCGLALDLDERVTHAQLVEWLCHSPKGAFNLWLHLLDVDSDASSGDTR